MHMRRSTKRLPAQAAQPPGPRLQAPPEVLHRRPLVRWATATTLGEMGRAVRTPVVSSSLLPQYWNGLRGQLLCLSVVKWRTVCRQWVTLTVHASCPS